MERMNQAATLVRDCVSALYEIVEQTGGDPSKDQNGFADALQPLLAHNDLASLTVARDGNHTTNTRWLYYDGNIGISLGVEPGGREFPIHNHGVWEAVAIYEGAAKYREYARLDPGLEEYYARLELTSSRILRVGDVVCSPLPPNDVHGFTCLADQTGIIGILGGRPASVRQYFNPDEEFYVNRNPGVFKTQSGGSA